jgi:alpha-tubulin suppressor-like RCC1 family protein
MLGGLFGGWELPSVPVQVPGLPPIASVRLIANEFVALAQDGTLWKWVDLGPWEPPYVFQLEGLPGPVVDIGFNGHATHVLLADGTVWSAGSNYYGALGIPGAGVNQPWAPVPGATSVASIAANGSRVLALRADGTALSWGSNGYGAIGDGISPLHLTPTRALLPCRLTAVGRREGEPQSCTALP